MESCALVFGYNEIPEFGIIKLSDTRRGSFIRAVPLTPFTVAIEYIENSRACFDVYPLDEQFVVLV